VRLVSPPTFCPCSRRNGILLDQLEEKTEIVYDLRMLNEEAENQLGIVNVSNQPLQKVQLDLRS